MPKPDNDDLGPVDGPFRVPESQFPPSNPPEPGFSDEDVMAAMNESQWVTEGDPDLNPYEDDEPQPPAPPPLPPPPAGRTHWATVDPKDRRISPQTNTAVPPETDVDSPEPPPPRAAPAPVEQSGYVVEIGAKEPAEDEGEEADSGDMGSSAMTYAAIGIIAGLLGMGGAGIVAFLLLQLNNPAEAPPEISVVPIEDEGAPKVEVRRDLHAPPKPEKVEIAPAEPPSDEVPTGEREVVGEVIEKPKPAPAPAPPAGEHTPIGGKLD